MKEHPILFSGEMVRAILDGRKTQTRRVVKPWPMRKISRQAGCDCTKHFCHIDDADFKSLCPYGQPGDGLWVRETWVAIERADKKVQAFYQADGHTFNGLVKYRPSIHMPRWASRITLEITEIRVERVKEINEADAKAEGVELIKTPEGPWPKNTVQMYHLLWDSLNGGKAPWASNPWVWVIGFKKVTNG